MEKMNTYWEAHLKRVTDPQNVEIANSSREERKKRRTMTTMLFLFTFSEALESTIQVLSSSALRLSVSLATSVSLELLAPQQSAERGGRRSRKRFFSCLLFVE
jgi:hypothetical protein